MRQRMAVYHATIGQHVTRGGPFAGAPDPGAARVSEVLLVVTIVMAILAGANAIFTTWATVLDARRFAAVTRSLGATQNQAVAGLSAAQLLPRWPGHSSASRPGRRCTASSRTVARRAARPSGG